MARVERSIVVNASPDEIEANTTLNPGDWNTWFVGIEESVPDGNYPNIGAKVKVTYKSAGLTFNLTQTLVEFNPGEITAFEMDGMIKGTQVWTVEPANGGTRVNVVFDYQMPGGGLGKIADKLVVERMNTKNLEESLENLKQMLEG